MSFRKSLHESEEFQAVSGNGKGGQRQSQPNVEVPEPVDPVISLEKSDVEFWLQVAQLIMLYLIWRELSGGA